MVHVPVVTRFSIITSMVQCHIEYKSLQNLMVFCWFMIQKWLGNNEDFCQWCWINMLH